MTARQQSIEDQLRQAILNAGITRYRIGKLSGVSETSLSFFVAGKRSLRLDMAAKIAAVLGLELRPAERRQAGKGKGR